MSFKVGNAKKNKLIDDFINKTKNKSVVVIRNKGLNVKEIEKLRRNAVNNNSKVIVMKNTLAKIAFNKLEFNKEILNHLKYESVFIVSENAIDALGSIKNANEKKIELVLFYDNGEVVSDHTLMKKIIKLGSLKKIAANAIAHLQMPISQLQKVLEIAASKSSSNETTTETPSQPDTPAE